MRRPWRSAFGLHASGPGHAAAALSGEDPLARESLDVFCGLLGSVVGDMALLYGVQGGVYLAGGILPGIRDFLINSSFVARFLNKGSMREALERIPVKLVEHGQLGWWVPPSGTWSNSRKIEEQAPGQAWRRLQPTASARRSKREQDLPKLKQ